MSKHTPGPWFVAHANHKGGSGGTSVWAAGGSVVISESPSKSLSLEGRRANARLIAAAPTMFEEIEREYTELADIRNNWKGRHTLEGQQKLCRLRDLICLVTGRDHVDVQDDYSTRLINAKATGEQP